MPDANKDNGAGIGGGQSGDGGKTNIYAGTVCATGGLSSNLDYLQKSPKTAETLHFGDRF